MNYISIVDKNKNRKSKRTAATSLFLFLTSMSSNKKKKKRSDKKKFDIRRPLCIENFPQFDLFQGPLSEERERDTKSEIT